MDIIENRAEWQAEFDAGWLKHYHETGETNWKLYNLPRNKIAPSGKALDLTQSRLVLISSAGTYLKEAQEPFDDLNDLGDYTIRTYPIETQWEALAIAHTHYDHTAVNTDHQVLLPFEHLHNMVANGQIGELAPEVISFMGYQPIATNVVDETIPAIVEAVKAQNAHGALLVPA